MQGLNLLTQKNLEMHMKVIPAMMFMKKEMDLHNNSIGYHLGNQAIINGWSEEELLNQVIDAADNGRLKILE